MNRTLTLTLSLLLLTKICNALDLEKNWWYDFDGKIGQAKISLSLYVLDNGELTGNYCYQTYETKILLTGHINGNEIELKELINGKTNGYFDGKVFTDTRDRFEGVWTDSSKNKNIEFKLTLTSALPSSRIDHRYSFVHGEDSDVESFMKLVKRSVLNKDKLWIANNTEYPISLRLNNDKAVTINNSQQLIDNFDQIFTDRFIEKLKSTCTCNLFCNYRGVMLGNGIIWIYDKTYSNSSNYNYVIITINN
jgi:hypothetical protein